MRGKADDVKPGNFRGFVQVSDRLYGDFPKVSNTWKRHNDGGGGWKRGAPVSPLYL